MDFSTEYDTNKADTPENCRAMRRILGDYARMIPVDGDADQEKALNDAVRCFLRVLADYSDPELTTTEGLETAIQCALDNFYDETYYLSVLNHLRYADIVFLSAETSAYGDSILSKGLKGEKCIPLYTRSKWIEKDLISKFHWHRTNIFDILDQCDCAEVDTLTLNHSYNKAYYSAEDIRSAFEEFEVVDEFWKNLRHSGVEGSYLFPLLAQDFLDRNVCCIYGSNEKEVTGIAAPYKSWQAPGYNIRTSGGRTVYVPLDEIVEIRELPSGDKGE
ncbi:MAG: hypothetical protein LUE27_08205 [Clostridia bacterium]|nr:hypothetical protein [Clostridia bacterium]